MRRIFPEHSGRSLIRELPWTAVPSNGSRVGLMMKMRGNHSVKKKNDCSWCLNIPNEASIRKSYGKKMLDPARKESLILFLTTAKPRALFSTSPKD